MFGVISKIWTEIITWLVSSITSLAGIFVTEASGTYSLTFMGEIAMISLGIGVVFLVLRFIENKLHFRG